MSNIYIQEPPTSGKVVIKTSVGDIDLELWTKEAPKACRNFIQLCMEGYYDNTIFHRVVKGFIVQGGDPTGTGEGGQSIYGQPFKDEFHTRLRFCRRGLLAMANAGKDDNASQFFFTLGATPELQNKHTIFGKVTGETIYNMLKLEDALVDENDRPLYPQKIVKTDVITNPFKDIEPRVVKKSVEETSKEEKSKKSGVKNFKLLSFGEEAEEDEEETVVLSKQFSGKSKSAHDNLSDPKLSSVSAIEPSPHRSQKRKQGDDSDSEDDGQKLEELAATSEETRNAKERIKNKLKDTKSKLIKTDGNKIEKPQQEEEEEEEYYLGKDRVDERKKAAEAIRKEIRDFKRGVQSEKKSKEASAKEATEAEEKKEAKSELIKQYMETQEKYKEAKAKVPKKGASREDFALTLLKKFQKKLQAAKENSSGDGAETSGSGGGLGARKPDKSDDEEGELDGNDDDANDESWMTHALRCEDKAAVLAKDASTKDDDWFEIYDPRNPLNKRRRGENHSQRSKNK